MDDGRGTTEPAPERRVEEGGDPACWLGQVCPECGRLTDGDAPATCPNCGAALPSD